MVSILSTSNSFLGVVADEFFIRRLGFLEKRDSFSRNFCLTYTFLLIIIILIRYNYVLLIFISFSPKLFKFLLLVQVECYNM